MTFVGNDVQPSLEQTSSLVKMPAPASIITEKSAPHFGGDEQSPNANQENKPSKQIFGPKETEKMDVDSEDTKDLGDESLNKIKDSKSVPMEIDELTSTENPAGKAEGKISDEDHLVENKPSDVSNGEETPSLTQGLEAKELTPASSDLSVKDDVSIELQNKNLESELQEAPSLHNKPSTDVECSADSSPQKSEDVLNASFAKSDISVDSFNDTPLEKSSSQLNLHLCLSSDEDEDPDKGSSENLVGDNDSKSRNPDDDTIKSVCDGPSSERFNEERSPISDSRTENSVLIADKKGNSKPISFSQDFSSPNQTIDSNSANDESQKQSSSANEDTTSLENDLTPQKTSETTEMFDLNTAKSLHEKELLEKVEENCGEKQPNSAISGVDAEQSVSSAEPRSSPSKDTCVGSTQVPDSSGPKTPEAVFGSHEALNTIVSSAGATSTSEVMPIATTSEMTFNDKSPLNTFALPQDNVPSSSGISTNVISNRESSGISNSSGISTNALDMPLTSSGFPVSVGKDIGNLMAMSGPSCAQPTTQLDGLELEDNGELDSSDLGLLHELLSSNSAIDQLVMPALSACQPVQPLPGQSTFLK